MSNDDYEKLLKIVPKQPQDQRSTYDQLVDLLGFANRLGLYDAADCIKKLIDPISEKLKKG